MEYIVTCIVNFDYHCKYFIIPSMISHTNKAHRQDLPMGPGRGWGKILEYLVQIKSCNVAILSVRNGKAFVCRH